MTNRISPERRGAAAVEFALLLPLLVALVMAIAEFGFLFFVQGSVAGAARESVRYYAIHYGESGAEGVAIGIAKAATPAADQASVTFSPACTKPGVQTTATVNYSYSTLTGWFEGLLGTTISLTGKGTMRCGG